MPLLTGPYHASGTAEQQTAISRKLNASGRPSSKEIYDSGPRDALEGISTHDLRRDVKWACNFPVSTTDEPPDINSSSTRVAFEDSELLYSVCEELGYSPATVMKVGWLLVLYAYTGCETVFFDCPTPTCHIADRADGTPDGGEDASVCLLNLPRTKTLREVFDLVEYPQQRDGSQQVPDHLVLNTALITNGENHPVYNRTCTQNLGKYAICVRINMGEPDVLLDLVYSSASIGVELAHRVGRTYRTILRSILLHPDQPFASVETLSEPDQSQILRWNENVPPALHQRLHQAFAEKALDNPDAPAILSWDGTWTYSELNDASSSLAEHLTNSYAIQDASTTISFCFERSGHAVLTMLAILKAGFTCIPLDPTDYGEVTLDKVIRDAASDLVCVSAAQAHRFAGSKEKMLVVDAALVGRLENKKKSFKPIGRLNNDIAFIQYSGGETGARKAVIQGHAGLYTGILAYGQAMGYDIDSRILHSSEYTSIVGVSEIFGAFFYGGCVVVLPERQSIESQTDLINDQEVTHACFTPTSARTLDPADLWQLSTVALGGQTLTSDDVEKWGFGSELIKTYGATETSVYISASQAPSPHVFNPSNIGAPFVASMWVVNPHDIQRLVPIGAVGELIVGGPTLALGYLNDPVRTSRRFITNPAWAPQAMNGTKQRFFVTGDLVRHLGNGELAFCGRKNGTESKGKRDSTSARHASPEIPPFSLISPIDSPARAVVQAAASCNIGEHLIQDIYPSTAIQESLFALSTKQPGAFIKQHIFELPSSLHLQRFYNAWEQTFRQSPILRTRLVMTDSAQLMQVVVKKEPECHYVSDLETYLQQDRTKAMGLGAPLVRYAIAAAPNQEPHLVLTMHHAIYDGWTLGLLFDRVRQNFEGNSISTKGIAFNAFVKHVQGLDQARCDQFWTDQLENASATLFPALPTPTYLPTPNDTYSQSVSFRRREGSSITASSLVRAAWALTVARYADSDDITFGSTVSGRAAPISGVATMLGPTIATVPVRVSVPKDGKLGDFLQRVQDQSTMMIPFEQAGMYHIKQLSEGTQTACNFQTAIVVQPLAAAPGLDTMGCRRVNEMYDSYQPYALTIELGLHEGGGLVRALYDNKVMDKLQVRRVISLFTQTLQRISVESSEVLLDGLATITPDDIEELERWNTTPPGPVVQCVHEAFQRQVASNPTSPAIASWDGDLTYGELDSLSTRLAHHLLSLGVTLEMAVPLCFDKSKWVVVSMLAVLKAGGSCLTLDVSHPLDRLRTMVEAVDGKIMLLAEAHRSKFVNVMERAIVVDEALFQSLEAVDSLQCGEVRPNNRAFIVFTSGSTGTPKGIELEHMSVCTSSRAHAAVFDIGPGCRCLQFSAFAFDVHISDIFTPLMYGACCCIPSEEDRMGNLPRAINNLQADSVYITPTVATLFTPDDVPGMKKVALGGEPLTTENARLWGGRVFLINVFGPSETSNWVTYQVVRPDTQQPSNIGPGVDVCTWLVDPHNDRRLAPIGCAGELFVEGPILARGYLKDQAKTTASFVVDPPWLPTRSPTPRRMYRTGDLVRYNSDGTFVYVGRQDTQIKIRGQRLELAEVNHRLMEIPEVKTCLAVLPKVGLCRGRCVAVLSLRQFWKDGSSAEMRMTDASLRNEVSSHITEIRDRLTETLAVWMIPTLWIVMEDLPANASGKLDRNRIRTFVDNLDEESYQRSSELLIDAQFQEPQTPTEVLLQQIWSSVLRLPVNQISVTASFLRLGGDSITAMQVMSKCRAEDVFLSVHDILVSKTISDLAIRAGSSSEAADPTGVKTNQANTDPPPQMEVPSQDENALRGLYDTIRKQASLDEPDVESIAVASDYQVSALEQALLSFRGDMLYHTFIIRRPANLDRVALSCTELVKRHPLLRSVFVCHERQTFRVIMKSWPFEVTDHREQQQGSVEALITQDRMETISLGQPLVWFKLVRQSHSHKHDTLVMRLPHCLYDATTRAALVADLERTYIGNRETSQHPLDTRAYFDLRAYMRPTALKYWEEYLQGSTATQIVAKPGPRFRHGRQYTVSKDVDMRSLTAHGIPPVTVVKAAWGFVLADLCGQGDVTFGEVVAGRGLPIAGIETLDTVAAETIPLRIQLRRPWTVIDLLRDVQERHLTSMPFETLGTASIVEHCTPWPRWTRFGSVINHAALPPVEDSDAGALVATGMQGHLNPGSDLNIQTHPVRIDSGPDTRLSVKITFDMDYISPTLVSGILDRYCATIRHFTTDVTTALSGMRQGLIGSHTIPLPFSNGPIKGFEMAPLDAADYERVLGIVQSVWNTVIGEDLGMDTSFLSCWGSLIAAASFSSAYREFGVDITMEEVLEAPTIRAQVVMCAGRMFG